MVKAGAQVPENQVRGQHPGARGGRQQGDAGVGGIKVGGDVRNDLPLIDAPLLALCLDVQVVPSQGYRVVTHIAEEIDFLKRSSQAARPLFAALLIGGTQWLVCGENGQAHQANDLGGTPNVIIQRGLVVGGGVKIAAH